MLESKKISDVEAKIFLSVLSLFLGLSIIGILKDLVFLPILVFALLGIVGVVLNYRNLYTAFFILVPFSMPFYLGSLGMDIPTEPIMLILTGLGIVLFFNKFERIDARYILNRLSIVLILHIVWILFTSLFSENMLISVKYLLAKLWYIIPFYFLWFYVYDKSFVVKIFKVASIFLFIATSVVLVRHYQYDFDFKYYNVDVYPIFRNHVIYAAMLVVVLPFTWMIWVNTTNKLSKAFWLGVMLVFIIGTYFSYTRAAQACIVIAVGTYYVIKYKLTRLLSIVAFVSTIGLGMYLVNDNKYLDFKPDFEKTITHYSYDNLLDATLKMQDISTMERVYRWVAGGHMIAEQPWTGQGPGNFYETYKKYTENGFKTYVSDNPEKSGIHNYFLMVLVEQGIIGLLIYTILNFGAVLIGERVYHRLNVKFEKSIVMASICCIVVITALHMMNDLIEVDKIGPFYFLSLAIIVIYDIKTKKLT